MKNVSPNGRSPEERILFASSKIIQSQEDAQVIEEIISGGVNWERLIGLAASCEILPLVIKNILRAENSLIPKPALSKIYKRCQKEYTLNNLILWNEFKEILRICGKENIPILAIKGIALTELLYKDTGVRRTSDIDIMINTKDLLRLEPSLRKLGYGDDPDEIAYLPTRKDILKKSQHLSLKKAGSLGYPIVLNLHWDILSPLRTVKNLTSGFWQRAAAQEVRGERIKTLSWEDTLLVSIFEIYKDFIQKNNFLAKRYLDISQIIELYGDCINWQEFIRHSNGYGVRGLVYFALSSHKELCHTRILPQEVLEKLKPSAVKRFFINKFIRMLDLANPMFGLRKIIFYFFVSEVILFPNRWRVFLIRSFSWAYPGIAHYKNLKLLNYFAGQSLWLSRRFLKKVIA
ncbi:MAG: nucleotidyltransferase family protein [Candidatus Omnitrophota bacterium]